MAMKTANVSDKNYSLALPGNYSYMVMRVSRDYFSGNSTSEACDQYDVDIRIDCGDQGTRDLTVHMRDNAKQGWRIAQFLVACAACKPDANGDVSYDPEWCDQMEGRTGTLRLWNRSFERNGATEWANEVKFLNPANVGDLRLGPQPGATLPATQGAAPSPAPAQPDGPLPAPAADDIPF